MTARCLLAVVGRLEFSNLCARNDMVMHFVRAVRVPQGALICVHVRQGRPLGNPCRTMDLHGFVNDVADFFRHHRLDHRHPNAGLFVAQNIHRFGGFEDHEPHGLNLNPRAAEHFHVLA